MHIFHILRETDERLEEVVELGVEELLSQEKEGPENFVSSFNADHDHPFLHPSLYAPRAAHEENGTVNIRLKGSFAYPSMLLQKSQVFDSKSGMYESFVNGGIIPLIALPGPPKDAFHNELLSGKH